MMERVLGLHEQIEDRLQHLRGDAIASVADPNQCRAIAVPGDSDSHAASGRCVLDGVAQEVDLDLLQTVRVAEYQQRLRGEFDVKLQVPVLYLRADRIRRLRGDCAQVDNTS